MKKHIIDDQEIKVYSKGLVKHAWCTVEFIVETADGTLFRSPKQFEGLKSVVKFKLKGEENEYQLITKRPASLILSKYKIILNDKEIDAGTVRAENWYMLYGLLLLGMTTLYVLPKLT